MRRFLFFNKENDMDIIQMLALAEREQHTERARMLGHLASESRQDALATDCDALDLDLEQIPHFLTPDYQGATA